PQTKRNRPAQRSGGSCNDSRTILEIRHLPGTGLVHTLHYALWREHASTGQYSLNLTDVGHGRDLVFRKLDLESLLDGHDKFDVGQRIPGINLMNAQLGSNLVSRHAKNIRNDLLKGSHRRHANTPFRISISEWSGACVLHLTCRVECDLGNTTDLDQSDVPVEGDGDRRVRQHLGDGQRAARKPGSRRVGVRTP